MTLAYISESYTSISSTVFYVSNYQSMDIISLHGVPRADDKFYKRMSCCIGKWRVKKK
jgi:hypothetical protein